MKQAEVLTAFKNAGCPFDDLLRAGNGSVTRNNLLTLMDGKKDMPEYKIRAISAALEAVTA